MHASELDQPNSALLQRRLGLSFSQVHGLLFRYLEWTILYTQSSYEMPWTTARVNGAKGDFDSLIDIIHITDNTNPLKIPSTSQPGGNVIPRQRD